VPEYKFHNKKTGKTWKEWMTISARDEFVKNPDIEQLVFGAPRLVTRHGSGFKLDTDFKSKLKAIKKANPGSTIDTY
jgi:hypothetical protein